jgi:hypothetical protein
MLCRHCDLGFEQRRLCNCQCPACCCWECRLCLTKCVLLVAGWLAAFPIHAVGCPCKEKVAFSWFHHYLIQPFFCLTHKMVLPHSQQHCAKPRPRQHNKSACCRLLLSCRATEHFTAHAAHSAAPK